MVSQNAGNMDGSSFSALSLSQCQLSHEVPAGEKTVECKGMLRPAFELLLDATRQLAPNPAVEANALCLFTVKKFTVMAKALVAL